MSKKYSIQLPFKGKWYVEWDGDTRDHRKKSRNQKFAIDFLMVDEQIETTHKGKGLKNTDYYCFNKEILAPADGVVSIIINGVKDNKPGESNIPNFGNALIIRHSKNVVSILAHLKSNSIRVKLGDKVKAGQVLGSCGNSGHTAEPHLHFHLQTDENSLKAKGIRIILKKVFVKNKNKIKEKDNYSPKNGDIIWQE